MTLRVMVYGSLRQGMGNDIHRFAQHCNAEMIKKGLAKIKANMFSLGGFPYISFPKEEEGAGFAVGEVYEIFTNQDRMLEALDRLEGYPTFYDRKEVDTEHGKAWVYFFHEDRQGVPQVEDGDWVKYKTKGAARNETV